MANLYRQRFDKILVEMIREGKRNKKIRQNRWLAKRMIYVLLLKQYARSNVL